MLRSAGGIPKELGGLKNLQKLVLNSNKLNGERFSGRFIGGNKIGKTLETENY